MIVVLMNSSRCLKQMTARLGTTNVAHHLVCAQRHLCKLWNMNIVQVLEANDGQAWPNQSGESRACAHYARAWTRWVSFHLRAHATVITWFVHKDICASCGT